MGPILAILAIALDLFALYFIVKSKASPGMKVIWIVLVSAIAWLLAGRLAPAWRRWVVGADRPSNSNRSTPSLV